MSPDDEVFWSLAWAHGQLTVRAVGGMLAPLQFDLPGGRRISPLYVAPWAEEGGPSALSGLMRQLRGEWPCVPFGPAQPPEGLPSGWAVRGVDSPWDHGYAANHAWTLVDRSDASITLRIELPAEQPVAWMERRIRVDSEGPAVSVELTMQPRRDSVLPFALHPTFAIPPGGVHLVPGAFAAVHTYPRQPELGVSWLTPNQSAGSLDTLPCDEGTLDLSVLPLGFATEELLRPQDCSSPFLLSYPDGIEVRLDWDREHLPDVLLWISRRGRRHEPWNGRNQALGVDPCNSCFDLTRVAQPPETHPLSRRRGLELEAGTTVRMAYRISACSGPSQSTPDPA
jgi:hypothetical protein